MQTIPPEELVWLTPPLHAAQGRMPSRASGRYNTNLHIRHKFLKAKSFREVLKKNCNIFCSRGEVKDGFHYTFKKTCLKCVSSLSELFKNRDWLGHLTPPISHNVGLSRSVAIPTKKNGSIEKIPFKPSKKNNHRIMEADIGNKNKNILVKYLKDIQYKFGNSLCHQWWIDTNTSDRAPSKISWLWCICVKLHLRHTYF